MGSRELELNKNVRSTQVHVKLIEIRKKHNARYNLAFPLKKIQN